MIWKLIGLERTNENNVLISVEKDCLSKISKGNSLFKIIDSKTF